MVMLEAVEKTARVLRVVRMHFHPGIDERVEGSCIRRCYAGEISSGFGFERMKRARCLPISRSFKHEVDARCVRRPDAEMRPAITGQFGADRVTTNEGFCH